MKNIKYIRLVLPVRYKDDDMPLNMPFRNGNVFDITYDTKSGIILNFDKEIVNINHIINWNIAKKRIDKYKLQNENIFILDEMKVTDEGKYYLLDKNLNILYSLEEEYVPDSHSIDGEYGDYVNLHIDFKNGKILNLKKNATFKEFLA